jgi:hypothetical protein
MATATAGGPPLGAVKGLGHLERAEYVFVQQQVEHFEALTGFETGASSPHPKGSWQSFAPRPPPLSRARSLSYLLLSAVTAQHDPKIV